MIIETQFSETVCQDVVGDAADVSLATSDAVKGLLGSAWCF